MPTVNVDQQYLFENLATEEFRELCFEFGIELEEDTSEYEMAVHQIGEAAAKTQGLSQRSLYKIDVPANRYDLLCQEGIVLALKVFLGIESPPSFQLVPPASMKYEKIYVKQKTSSVRPHIVGAILRNIQFTEQSYESFIALQEKLHHTVCRNRSLVAIGTHDYDTLQGPFTYEAKAPSSIRFTPLNETQEMDAASLLGYYRQHAKHLAKYIPLLEPHPVFPVIYDARRVVCSLPPLINGDHSKISVHTKNVFIECTATDPHRAMTVLTIITALFSTYTTPRFGVEPVEVHAADGSVCMTPIFAPKSLEVDVQEVGDVIGVRLDTAQVQKLLLKMGLATEPLTAGRLRAHLPLTRPDILHARDIVEDVAIAYGYARVPRTLPRVVTVGRAQPLQRLGDHVRHELAMLGYTEVLPLTLCSLEEAFTFLQRPIDLTSAVVLANPATAAYQVVRTALLPGLLKTVAEHTHHRLPLRLFEVGDIVLRDAASDTHAHNERRVAVAYADKTSVFQVVQGVLEWLMTLLGAPLYRLQALADHPTFFPGRGVEIFLKDVSIGHLGILHPHVLRDFNIGLPVTILEFNLEPFL